MRRATKVHSSRAAAAAPAPSGPLPVPHTVHPETVYFADQLRAIFRLRESSLRREIRAGRLRFARVGGRYLFTGRMVLDWLAVCERRAKRGTNRKLTPADANHHDNGQDGD